MATNKPDTRKTHITRIFGTNKAGDRLDDMWVDVERMDLVKSATQVPNTDPNAPMQWQGYQRKFRWCDDPNDGDYEKDGTPSRKTEILKVCDPEQEDNVNDPKEWVPVKVIKGLRARVETGTENNGGSAQERFLSSVTAEELRTARVVEVRKIVHYDTNIDDAAQAAFDSGQDEYVVSSNDYEKDTSTKDDEQYVDHEIITYLKHKGNAAEVSGIGRQTKLLNDYLLNENDPAQGDVIGQFGFNPPYRLDPYQNIVNVSFGGLAVEYNPNDSNGHEAKSWVVGYGDADMRKAVVSLWFRIPAATKAKAAARGTGQLNNSIPTGTIPLLVFGPQYNNTIYTWTFSNLVFKSPPSPFPEEVVTTLDEEVGYVSDQYSEKSPPSYIGINCQSGGFSLEVNIQTADHPSCDSTSCEITAIDVHWDPDHLIGGFVTSYALDQAADDVSYVDEGVCESFGNADYFTGHTEVTDAAGLSDVDQWHHVLLSWDVTRGCSTKGTGTNDVDFAHAPDYVGTASKMWCAIDDANFDGDGLPAMWTYATYGAGDRNSIMSNVCQKFAGQAELGTDQHRETGTYGGKAVLDNNATDYDFGNPTATIVPSHIPLSPCYVPSPPELGSNPLGYDIEMAEVQIWSGVSLDTSNIGLRRLFIDADGEPVLDYRAADGFLGKPVVRLHGTGGLKGGTNKGTLPDFDPNGTIKKYKPPPSLYGPQFPTK